MGNRLQKRARCQDIFYFLSYTELRVPPPSPPQQVHVCMVQSMARDRAAVSMEAQGKWRITTSGVADKSHAE